MVINIEIGYDHYHEITKYEVKTMTPAPLEEKVCINTHLYAGKPTVVEDLAARPPALYVLQSTRGGIVARFVQQLPDKEGEAERIVQNASDYVYACAEGVAFQRILPANTAQSHELAHLLAGMIKRVFLDRITSLQNPF